MMPDPLLFYLRLALAVAIALSVVVCPFTKTEESQNMHAIYDLFYKGVELETFDHLQFQGVVPRTFVGPKSVRAGGGC